MPERNQENLFLRVGERIWRCRFCGKVLVQIALPEKCPVCGKLDVFAPINPEKY